MWPFKRSNRFNDAVDLDILVAAEDSPTKRYVNLLLMQLTRAGGGAMTLHESQPMPRPTTEPGVAIPTFAMVTNRFKVMSNLDPILYREPKVGSIELIVSGEPFVVRAHFNDKLDDRSLTIELNRGQLSA